MFKMPMWILYMQLSLKMYYKNKIKETHKAKLKGNFHSIYE